MPLEIVQKGRVIVSVERNLSHLTAINVVLAIMIIRIVNHATVTRMELWIRIAKLREGSVLANPTTAENIVTSVPKDSTTFQSVFVSTSKTL